MKENLQKYIPVQITLLLSIAFGAVLMIYARPMEDVTLDLSLVPRGEVVSQETFDEKGWEVYTREGDVITYLEPNGHGSYLGIELGQTLYLSRILEEDLDSPTLQLGAGEQTFSVWLDDDLIYTDCPHLDNRIGHLRLPMNSTYRSAPVTISLPLYYQGKTLTIAHSTPEYSETPTLKATPASVVLYCGYAYESGIVSESYFLTIGAAALFAVGLLLLLAFLRRRVWSLLSIALTAFLCMYLLLVNTSFYYRYFGANELLWFVRWFVALALLTFLTLKAGQRKRVMQGVLAACILYTPVSAVLYFSYHSSILYWPAFLFYTIPELLFMLSLAAALVLGMVYWRKENRFYRLYAPLTLTSLAVYWVVKLLQPGVAKSLAVGLASGTTYQLYWGCLTIAVTAALITTLWEALKNELEQRREQEQRRELALASYENLRRQHEEVMMLRHDMLRHFHTLHDMADAEKITDYLAKLIGQSEKIRPIVESGNEMLDIILNGKLGAAIDAGISVEIQRVEAPKGLPLSDPDLCSLVMNIVDNAIDAASSVEAETSYIRLNIHEKDGYLAITCENNAGRQDVENTAKKETVPKHGLGLKIIRSITERYEGVMIIEDEADCFKVKIVLPLT